MPSNRPSQRISEQPQELGEQPRSRRSKSSQKLEDKSTAAESTPNTWWKWVLLYPGLLISVISAIPTYVELAGSASLGVPYGQYKTAIRENELWKENIDCAAAPFDGLVNEQKVEVDAVVCLSGNVLVRIKPPGKNTAYKWVPLEESAGSEKRAAAFSFIGSAFAQVPPPPPGNGNFQVLCQQWVGNGLIRRRILDRTRGVCFDEVVNTFNGQVINSEPAPCNC